MMWNILSVESATSFENILQQKSFLKYLTRYRYAQNFQQRIGNFMYFFGKLRTVNNKVIPFVFFPCPQPL